MIASLQKIEQQFAALITADLIDGNGIPASELRALAYYLRVIAVKVEAQAEMAEAGLYDVEAGE